MSNKDISSSARRIASIAQEINELPEDQTEELQQLVMTLWTESNNLYRSISPEQWYEWMDLACNQLELPPTSVTNDRYGIGGLILKDLEDEELPATFSIQDQGVYRLLLPTGGIEFRGDGWDWTITYEPAWQKKKIELQFAIASESPDFIWEQIQGVLNQTIRTSGFNWTHSSPEDITFNRNNDPYGWMSSMYKYPIHTLEDGFHRTAEHYFQAKRFSDKHTIRALREIHNLSMQGIDPNHLDYTIPDLIREQPSPMMAKGIRTKYGNFMLPSYQDKDWKGVLRTLNLMKQTVELKVIQHPPLQQQLLNTGNKLIVEDVSSRPYGSAKIWGAAQQNNGVWIGENWLGVIWMIVRKDIWMIVRKEMTKSCE